MENHVKFKTPGTYTILEGQALKQHDPRLVTHHRHFRGPLRVGPKKENR